MDENPRKLTEDEIQDILSVIPDIKSAADTVSEQNTKSMKVLIREQLQDIELTPLGISDMKAEVLRQFNQSIIAPGTAVGFSASEALAKPITQGALNAFHTSGSAKNVSYGVERISELINATQKPKKTSCSIYFKDNFLSFDDIIVKKRPEITEITVKDLVIGMPNVESYDDIVEPYWYSLYRELIRDDFESTEVLRLDIDTNLLYAYKITMEEICEAIEQEGGVICVYSPISEGKIDIYPIESQIVSKLRTIEIVSEENAPLIFLSMIVVPALDKIKISGISGIQQIYPVEAPVWQIVKEEIPTTSFENGWFLILNPIRMKVTGITVDKLIQLCELVGMKVLKTRPNYIGVSSVISPTKLVNSKIQIDMDDEKEYEKKKKEEGARVFRRPPTEISIASKMIYADTTGSNLTELLSHPDIDATRTFCNNVHELREAFGIEAARTFLIKEFIEVIGYEGYINPRHIVLLVDYMTSLGKVSGVTFTGVSRQPIGALEKASFEKAMTVFQEAAGFGEEKTVAGTSASIFIGKKALVGTGFSPDFLKPENLERYNETRKELDTNPNMTLDIEAFNNVIDDFDVEIGDDVAILEGMEDEMFAISKEIPKEVKQPEVKPTTIGKFVPPEPNLLVKGKPVRSAELEEAGSELNRAPCLLPPKPSEVTITTLEKPEEVKKKFPLPETTGVGLLEEMQKIAESGRPAIPLAFPKVAPPRRREKAKPAEIFNLEEFLK